MSSSPSRRKVFRLGAGLASLVFALTAVGMVYADGFPATGITVTPSGLSVQASGTWSWPANATAAQLHYSGFAIDWGDVASGNQIGIYHIGDGTPATNVVMQPTTPDRGTSGTWGPASHTYAKAGTYTVCVIMYDLGSAKPFKTTGYHSLQAGGTNHNIDNSYDRNITPQAQCAQVTVTTASPSPVASTPVVTSSPVVSASPVVTATPFESFGGSTATPVVTATPFESFQGATSDPTGTPPPTSTDSGTGSNSGGMPLPMLLFGLACLFGMVALMPSLRDARTR